MTAGRTDSSRQVTLTDGRRRGTQEWFVWHRLLDAPSLTSHRVEIAFRVHVADGERRLARCDASPLVVFFPTEKETFLGFWIQGPYRTTPARDNVPSRDPSNQALVRETATLLADVLAELRDDGLLTVEVLQALPLDVARFAPGTMFRPLFDSVRAVLANEQVLPLAEGDHGTATGGYGTAAQLRLAGGAGLRELFGPEQLGAVYGTGQPLAFAHESITDAATPVLWRYLREEIGIGEITPDAIVGRLTSEFLTAQSDAWIGRFYAYLYQNSALWRAPRFPGEQTGPARTRPVIRLEDGTHIAPFDSDDRPAAYLPGDAWTGLPTVRRAIADVPAARQFLDALKLTEPDVVAEVLENILPRYARTDIADLDAAQHDADLECVALALAQAAPGRRHQLLDQLQQTAFLVGENAGTGERRLMTPTALYERAKDLEIYFDGNTDAWFADDAYGPWRSQLRGMGVRENVQLHARDPDHLGHVVTFDEFARHERGIGGFDPAAQIDGLDFALSHPSHARSEYIWNALLVPSRHLVAGVVEKSVRQEFADASRDEERSPIGTAATAQAWLPSPDGTFCRPAELRPDDLPSAYKRDETLANALGMVKSLIDEASRQLGIPADVLRGLSEHPDLVLRIEQELKSRSAAGQEPPPNVL